MDGRRRAAAAALLFAACLVAACGAATTPDNASFLDAYRAHRAAEVTVDGRVVEVLRDSRDNGSGPHQRFDVDVAGVRVEIDHNLDLAPRVPVTVGVEVVVHGQFEPDPGHPVIHETHHATGAHEGGWVELDGRRYD